MLSETIFTIENDQDFENVALRVFRHQYINNPIYQRFCNLLGVNKSSVTTLDRIPYLPIEFFKSKKVVSSSSSVKHIFTSSGTTGTQVSSHYVTDPLLYEHSFRKGFQYFYGAITDYTILALLPSYLERSGSSLIYMVEKLIADTNQSDSGFYLHNIDELQLKLQQLSSAGKKILLIGVSFALVDLIATYNFELSPTTIIMETGGMKGRKKEIIRSELHKILTNGFGVSKIHSEYGMTELLSQAYAREDGLFYCPPWMKVTTRDPEDALTPIKSGKTGGINIIDLANLNSCSFIATQDLGKTYNNNSFEILGRFDHSDIRGCNLMIL